MAESKVTASEEEKAAILTSANEGKITNAHAAKQLGLSIRQVQRAKIKVRLRGALGIAHGLKGEPSNHQLDNTLKEKALKLVKEKYADFKSTFASEKLEEIDGVSVNPQTLRRWMVKAGL